LNFKANNRLEGHGTGEKAAPVPKREEILSTYGNGVLACWPNRRAVGCFKSIMILTRVIKKTRLTGEGSRIGRQVWLDTARRMLIDDGVERVRIERIADKLGVTRGGFYWHFKDRKALLDELLRDWEKTNTEAFIAAIEEAPVNFESRVLRLFTLWIEGIFDADLEVAVRNWARTSKAVTNAIQRADIQRLKFLESLFVSAQFSAQEASVRARVLYYTQIGYYAVGERITREERLAVVPLYYKVYTGRVLSKAGADEIGSRNGYRRSQVS
jgi:AcrR family transcriptional regulator